MKISIITISYNNEKDIRQTIESVVNQTYNNIEYIIVDGYSKDDTLKIVEKYKINISKIISEPDNGIYDAINKGIKSATGDIVGLIHAGDILDNNYVIEDIAAIFVNDESVEAVYGHGRMFGLNGKVIRTNRSPIFKKSLFRKGYMPSHQGFYMKRSCFERHGYYNLKYKIAADYELLLRYLYVHDLNVKRYDGYVVRFIVGGASTKNVNNIIKANQECVAAWEDNGLKLPKLWFFFKALRKFVQFADAQLYNLKNNK